MFTSIVSIYFRKDREYEYIIINIEENVKPWEFQRKKTEVGDLLKLENGRALAKRIKKKSKLVKKTYEI